MLPYEDTSSTGAGGPEANNMGSTAGKMFCALAPQKARVLPDGVTGLRERLLVGLSNKWVNGTVLHYYFFDRDTDSELVSFEDGSTERVSWRGAKVQEDMVRQAFENWMQVGIGIKFMEVEDRSEAEIRIGFMKGDGSWSYLGRGALDHGPNERTMNFGWDLTGTDGLDTALHEIGHALGFPHEHQNPKAGIVWNEEAVYAALAAPPNRWNREKTFWNIIRKLPENEVQGTSWDPDSIMHYPFTKGLILKPSEFVENDLTPAGGLSTRDVSWALELYPSNSSADVSLKVAQSVLLDLAPAEQRNFQIVPDETRHYEIRTFGVSDTVMVLFENIDGELRYVTADDDGGEERNAQIKIKLFRGKKYVLRIRLYYAEQPGQTAVMMW